MIAHWTIWARREPTNDPATAHVRGFCPGAFAGAMDVVLYRDDAATEVGGRYAHDSRHKPDRRCKWLTLGGYRRRLAWLPDAGAAR